MWSELENNAHFYDQPVEAVDIRGGFGSSASGSSSGKSGGGAGGGMFSFAKSLMRSVLSSSSSSAGAGASAASGGSAASKPAAPVVIPEPRAPRGVFMYGGVGCGKTMMMDLFYKAVKVPRRKVRAASSGGERSAAQGRTRGQRKEGGSDPAGNGADRCRWPTHVCFKPLCAPAQHKLTPHSRPLFPIVLSCPVLSSSPLLCPRPPAPQKHIPTPSPARPRAPPPREQARKHFHHFMLDVHAQLHELRTQGGGVAQDPLPRIAQRFVEREGHLLCLDEFQVTDVADAMVLRHLFESLFARGCTVVATSNRRPDDLYLVRSVPCRAVRAEGRGQGRGRRRSAEALDWA